MIGRATMNISKEEMIAIVENYLNKELFNTAFRANHKCRVVDQIRKAGDRFIITIEGEAVPRPHTCAISVDDAALSTENGAQSGEPGTTELSITQ